MLGTQKYNYVSTDTFPITEHRKIYNKIWTLKYIYRLIKKPQYLQRINKKKKNKKDKKEEDSCSFCRLFLIICIL